MCVQMFSSMLGGGDLAGPAGMVQSGGTMQAVGAGLGALGDLAIGSTRAKMQRQDADAQRATGAAQAKRIRAAGRQEVGTSRAQATGAGVALTSGSALEAERNIVRNVEQDAGVAILNGENRARTLTSAARYSQLGGIGAASDSAFVAADRWKRSRRADAPADPLADFWRSGTTGD